jgi:hypothetical protein
LIRTRRSFSNHNHHYPAYFVKPGSQSIGTSDLDKAEKIIQKNFNITNIDLDAENNTNIRTYLIIILVLISLKKFLEIILISKLSFISSVPDWVKI